MTYDGRSVKALAFVTNPRHETFQRALLPTDRYIRLIQTGAKQMEIDASYRAWLDQIPSVRDNGRGQEYYETQSAAAEAGLHQRSERMKAPKKAPQARQKRIRTKVTRTDNHTVFAQAGSGPVGTFVRGHNLYVSDSKSHSVKLISIKSTNNGDSDGTDVSVVAGGNGKGRSPNQLNRPWRIYVDKRQENLYIVDRNNDRVQRRNLLDGTVVTVAGGYGPGSRLSQLHQPVDVFVLETASGAHVYVSDRANHRVVVWESGATEGRVVAGGNGFGADLDQFGCPGGLHVTSDGTIYVSDEANNRVMKWQPNEGGTRGNGAGQIVVGGHGAGHGSAQLYHPLGLWLSDEEDVLVVADSLGYRVQQFRLALTKNATGSGLLRADTIAGQTGKPGPLGQPMSVHIDAGSGDLFVADSDNARVQRYSASAQAACAKRNRRSCRDDGLEERASPGASAKVGRCTKFDARAGFGFVRDESDGRSYFAHHSDLVDSSVRYGYPALAEGDVVSFDARSDAKWKWRGTNIKQVFLPP